MLRILLADDHELTRKGLRFLLEEQKDWSICGEASNGRMAVTLADKLKPDFAILDISMPELNGLEATRQILKSQPRIKILIYTMHETEKIVVEALQAGARGLILKTDAGANMVTAVQSIVNGRRFFTSSVIDTVVDAFLATHAVGRDNDPHSMLLTTREKEILQLLAEGKSNKEVASTLFIADRTVEGHRREIMRKLGLGSIADLVRYAIRNGIIQP